VRLQRARRREVAAIPSSPAPNIATAESGDSSGAGDRMGWMRTGAAGRLALAVGFGLVWGGWPGAGPSVVRLGYFANVTHAPAIVALAKAFLASELGPGVKLELRIFNAGRKRSRPAPLPAAPASPSSPRSLRRRS
jgi:hypothetical protein